MDKLSNFFQPKKFFLIPFLVLGITSLISQVVLLRELLVSSLGNEFIFGIALFCWLAGTTLGSFCHFKRIQKKERLFLIYIFSYLLLSLLLPLAIIGIRWSSTLTSFEGELPSFFNIFFGLPLFTLPYCFILGLQFALGTRVFILMKENFEQKREAGAYLEKIIEKAYLWETLGFVFGGVIFNYFLVYFNEIFVILCLSFLNLVNVFFLICLAPWQKNRLFSFSKIFLAILLVLVAITLTSSKPELWNLKTLNFRFRNQELLKSKNTLYGNLAITKQESQHNFYQNGKIIASDKEKAFLEDLVHFPMLASPYPQEVLLLGGGFTGALQEILKYPVKRIYYLEINPLLLPTVSPYLSLGLAKDLENPKIEIVNQDGIFFLKNTPQKFDVIILNIDDPTTLQLGRFYTKEFFELVKTKLNEDGLLATYLSFSPDAIGEKHTLVVSSLFQTLSSVFPKIIFLPEDKIYFLASRDNILSYDSSLIIQRFKERKIKTDFITPAYLRYRLENDRIDFTQNLLQKNVAQENTIFSPILTFYYTLYWSTFFPSLFTKILALFLEYSWFFLPLVIISFLFLAVAIYKRRKQYSKSILVFTMALTSGVNIVIELIIIFLFQIFYGYVYYKITAIIILMMLGISLGNILVSWFHKKKPAFFQKKSLQRIQLAITAYLGLFLIFLLVFKEKNPSFLVQVLFPIFIVAIGFLEGAEFPLVNYLFLKDREDKDKKTGIVYGVDLIGAALGIILFNILLIPIFGIITSLLVLILFNGVCVILLCENSK